MSTHEDQPLRGLLDEAQVALRATRVDMAAYCGVGRTTFIEWIYGRGAPKPAVLTRLAVRVFEVDEGLAAELAARAGATLESLGLAEAPAPPHDAAPSLEARSPEQLRHLADSVVLAVAELLDRSPSNVRPIVTAAFERADAVGLSTREALIGLREGAKAASTTGT